MQPRSIDETVLAIVFKLSNAPNVQSVSSVAINKELAGAIGEMGVAWSLKRLWAREFIKIDEAAQDFPNFRKIEAITVSGLDWLQEGFDNHNSSVSAYLRGTVSAAEALEG